MQFRTWFLLLLAAASILMIPGCRTASQFFGQSEETVIITVLQTGSLHGTLRTGGYTGSISQAAALAADMRNRQDHVLLLDLGNMTGGSIEGYHSSFVDTLAPHIQSRIMRYMGYDAAVLGSRDIGYGTSVYQRIRQESGVPWLGANIVGRTSGESHVTPYRIIEKGGARIAVLGLTHPDSTLGLPERLIPGITVQDLRRSAERWIGHIRERENPDVIIGMIHAKDDRLYRHTAQNDAAEPINYRDEVLSIAREVRGFDIIFTNFSDEDYIETVRGPGESHVHVVNTASCSAGFVRIEMYRPRGSSVLGIQRLESRFIPLMDYTPDQGLLSLAAPYISRADSYADRIIGTLDEPLVSRESFFSDAPMTALLHTLQLSVTNAHVSFASPPAYDIEIPEGEIRAADLFSLLPNESYLFTMRLTGQEIKDYLEYSYGNWFNTMRGPYDNLIRFSQVNETVPYVPYYEYDSAMGIDYTVDVSKPSGQRVQITGFSNGRPFRLQDTYIAALNSYRITGGGGHLSEGAGISPGAAASRIVSSTARDIRHNLIRWFETHSTFSDQGRTGWYLVPESWGAAGRLNDYQLLFDQSPFME